MLYWREILQKLHIQHCYDLSFFLSGVRCYFTKYTLQQTQFKNVDVGENTWHK